MRLLFVTSNAGKVEEARAALAPLGIDVAQHNVGYPEVQADTLEEVARAGARHLAERLEAPFFLDDAGLFVDALKGFPGVYSSYVYKTLGMEGVLRLLEGAADRSARFEAVVAYGEPGHPEGIRLFKGACPGRLAESPRGGGHGFGYDPVFIPEGFDAAFSEIPAKEKNRVSHRGRALKEFARFLSERA